MGLRGRQRARLSGLGLPEGVGTKRFVPLAVGVVLGCAGPLTAQQACRVDWSLEETLRIGSLDGDDALDGVFHIGVSPSGEIFVPQSWTGSVMVFTPEGRFSRYLGRHGSGPGDFQDGPRAVAWLGDTLWVADRQRVQSFDADELPREFVTWRTRIYEEGSVYSPGPPLADGSLWGRRAVTPVEGERETHMALRRFDRQGATIDTIALLDVRNTRILVDPRGGFAAHPIWSSLHGSGMASLEEIVTSDRSEVVLVGEVREGRRSGSFDLLRLSIDGDTILQRSIDYEPRPISRGEERWWFDAFASFMAGDSTVGLSRYRPTTETERNRERERARDLFWLPDTYPPVRRVLAGLDDTTWLLREPTVLDPVDRWEVYDRGGALVGRVAIEGKGRRTPWTPRLRIMRASRTEVWTTSMDEFDVSYIHRFEVDRGCG